MGTLLKSRWQEILLDFFFFRYFYTDRAIVYNTVLMVLISREKKESERKRLSGGGITDSQNEMTEQIVKCPLQLYIYMCVYFTCVTG